MNYDYCEVNIKYKVSYQFADIFCQTNTLGHDCNHEGMWYNYSVYIERMYAAV